MVKKPQLRGAVKESRLHHALSGHWHRNWEFQDTWHCHCFCSKDWCGEEFVPNPHFGADYYRRKAISRGEIEG